MGLPKRRRAVVDAEFLAELSRLNGLLYTDSEIARELGCERHTVSTHRIRLGLPCRRDGERHKQQVAARTLAQVVAAGVGSLGELRSAIFAGRAVAAGWPPEVMPREVEILEVLAGRGPMTRRQIAEAVGIRWKGSRKSLTGRVPGGSYLAHLQRCGLVICLGRRIRGSGKGRSVCLYSLALGVQKGGVDVGA